MYSSITHLLLAWSNGNGHSFIINYVGMWKITKIIAAAGCTLAIPASHLELSNIQLASIRYQGGPVRWATKVLDTSEISLLHKRTVSEEGCQSLRCYIEAESAVVLSSEAVFQYTCAGKLSLAHVASETKLREVAMGFQGTGAERVLQEYA